MSLEKVVIVIIAMRVIDVVILFFSRHVKKYRSLIRGLLMTLATIVALAVLVMDLPQTRGSESQGAVKVLTSLANDSQKVVTERIEAVEIAKHPYIKGKKVATIGDSITELDGQTVKNVGPIIGYQEVFRQQGATVVNYGYSGATYALHDKKVSTGVHRSIYDMIVKAKVDFKEIDIVTLFGGTNDVGKGYPLGTPNDKTAATTLGGLRGIIDYIKTNNPKCQIFVFTPITRTDQANVQGKMEVMAAGIIDVAKSYNLPSDDLLKHAGITPENQGTYLYDKLHPNSDGMALVGQRMAEVIEASATE